jgi:hypothetical protein
MSGSKSDIVRALFAAYLSSDRKAVEDRLTEDFRFTGPYDDAIDKAGYFARCWRGSDCEGDKIKSIDVDFGATYGVFVKQSQ